MDKSVAEREYFLAEFLERTIREQALVVRSAWARMTYDFKRYLYVSSWDNTFSEMFNNEQKAWAAFDNISGLAPTTDDERQRFMMAVYKNESEINGITLLKTENTRLFYREWPDDGPYMVTSQKHGGAVEDTLRDALREFDRIDALHATNVMA